MLFRSHEQEAYGVGMATAYGVGESVQERGIPVGAVVPHDPGLGGEARAERRGELTLEGLHRLSGALVGLQGALHGGEVLGRGARQRLHERGLPHKQVPGQREQAAADHEVDAGAALEAFDRDDLQRLELAGARDVGAPAGVEVGARDLDEAHAADEAGRQAACPDRELGERLRRDLPDGDRAVLPDDGVDGGFQRITSGRVEVSVEGFYKDLDQLVSRVASADGGYEYQNLGRGYAKIGRAHV